MALLDLTVAGRSVGPGGDVSITLIPIVPGPGCAAAYSAGLEETQCSKDKAEGKLILTGAKVGRFCAAVGVLVNEVSHVKATFSATAAWVKVDGSKAPLRKNDSASGGSCSCTLMVSPFTPFSATFTGSIGNAGQTKVKGQ
jgi:hypothetical protein